MPRGRFITLEGGEGAGKSTQLLLLFVIALTVFSIAVAFPSDPNRYLPGFIPWPEEECAGPICIGKGIKVGGIDRREMRLGLDLRGGTRLVLEADTADNPDVDLDDAMDTAVDVVERRVNAFGVAESITERVGSNRISVQLPGISSDEAVDRIGRTAQLQFMEMARTPDGSQVYIKQADGTQTTQPIDTVRNNGALIQQAVWVPIVVTDDNGVQRELNGSYLDRGDIFITRDTLGQPRLKVAQVRKLSASVDAAEAAADSLVSGVERLLVEEYSREGKNTIGFIAWHQLFHLLEEMTDDANHCARDILSLSRKEA